MSEVSLESWARAAAGAGPGAGGGWCVMCLRAAPDVTLVSCELFRDVLTRFRPVTVTPFEISALQPNICRECRGLVRRCLLIAEAALQSLKFHKSRLKHSPELSHGLIVLKPELVREFEETRRVRRRAGALAPTQTLAVVSTNTGADLAPAPSNVILVPAYPNQLMQMSGGGLQLVQACMMQPIDTIDTINTMLARALDAPGEQTQNSATLVVSGSHAPRASSATRQYNKQQSGNTQQLDNMQQNIEREARQGAGSADPLFIPLGDENVVALIQTNIKPDDSDNDSSAPIVGEWITPDVTSLRPSNTSVRSYSRTSVESVPRSRLSARKRDSTIAAASTETSKMKRAPIGAWTSEVVSLDSDDEAPPSPSPSPSPPRAPAPAPDPSTVDWEDEIPREVIRTDQEIIQYTASKNFGLGRIMCVRSHADQSWHSPQQ